MQQHNWVTLGKHGPAVQCQGDNNGPSYSNRVNVRSFQLVIAHRMGKCGHPQKLINPLYLQDAFTSDHNISITCLSKTLHINRHTVRHNMKDNNIS